MTTAEWHSPKVSGQKPGARIGHSTVRLGNQVYVFAGKEGETVPESYLNTLHVLDLLGMRWRVVPAQHPPTCRAFHSANAIQGSNRFITFVRPNRLWPTVLP